MVKINKDISFPNIGLQVLKLVFLSRIILMSPKLIRITTIPLSLEKLLEGQLRFMNEHYEVIGISSGKKELKLLGIKNGIRTYNVKMTRTITPLIDLKAVIIMYRFFLKEKPAIVHTHTPKAGIVGMIAAKMAGVPIRLHTVAGMPLMETSGVKRRILEQVERFTYSLATKVYPNSIGLKKIILEHNFSKPEKLKVLGEGSSNGIDTQYFNPGDYPANKKKEIRQKLGIPEKDVVFVFVGRLVKDKGINELIQAFKRLNLEEKNTNLLLVGPFEQDLDPIMEENLEEIKHHPNIFTTGYRPDVRPYFAVSDALVFPSYREGFPNVVMQAGAMGIPSIVTNINGCNEIIFNGKNGLIIPAKDENALMEAMLNLVLNNLLRKKMSVNSRKEICSRFERKKFWEILLKEYKSFEEDYFKV